MVEWWGQASPSSSCAHSYLEPPSGCGTGHLELSGGLDGGAVVLGVPVVVAPLSLVEHCGVPHG